MLLRFAIEQNVFSGSEAGNQRELLVNHPDTGSKRVKGRGKRNLFTAEQNISPITAGLTNDIHSEKNLHQSALPCPVFTAETKDLPGPKG